MELTQRDHIKVDYPIAMSNRLFKSSELLKDVPWPCQNCHLISMGSMACYQEKCPDCGRTPPNRSPVWKGYLISEGVNLFITFTYLRFENLPQSCICKVGQNIQSTHLLRTTPSFELPEYLLHLHSFCFISNSPTSIFIIFVAYKTEWA